MKIALVSDCYLPRLGGIEVQVHDLAQRLVAQGHEVVAYTVTPAHREQHSGLEIVDGIPVHRFSLGLPHDVALNPMAVSQLRLALSKGGFDVVHAHIGVISVFSFDAVRLALDLGLPTAVTWHSVMAWAGPLLKPLGFVRRWAKGGAALSAVSQVAAHPIRDMAGRGHEVVVLPNGIDADAWTPGEPRTGDEVRVISAMRLATRKRPLEFFSVMKAVHREAPNVRLEIAGEGDLRPKLVRAVDLADAHEWVSLPGRMTRAQLHDRYRASDLYVAPARLESFGIAALEARSSGLPVVAPSTSGVSEFVTSGVNGLLAGDDDDLAQAIIRLALDTDLRRTMAEYNRTHRPAQTWDQVVRLAEAEYARAAALRAAR
ncbi:glycosyltransferase family 4 protein [Dermacoccus nishinomiyaensis]|uniref:glycosyltransferase family 4 protein n=1 Tax=Dermacoccus nishinomiyaensis TaxID=1274 RepID=UPI000DF9BBD1|nr:glycosyltransferase family 4 protein [Dermacoccus nishinomiyaensis]QQY24244.1 glycosyltransferase family 4 protein [Dermacoccus nishinomiyaensis]STD71304.1 Glycogen synthase [Dermacoccus nishinomiyaensis]